MENKPYDLSVQRYDNVYKNRFRLSFLWKRLIYSISFKYNLLEVDGYLYAFITKILSFMHFPYTRSHALTDKHTHTHTLEKRIIYNLLERI